jgi:hypothetical protein
MACKGCLDRRKKFFAWLLGPGYLSPAQRGLESVAMAIRDVGKVDGAENELAKGLNRLAAAAERRNVLSERAIAAQEAQLRVTAQLEAALALQAAGEPHGSAKSGH